MTNQIYGIVLNIETHKNKLVTRSQKEMFFSDADELKSFTESLTKHIQTGDCLQYISVQRHIVTSPHPQADIAMLFLNNYLANERR